MMEENNRKGPGIFYAVVGVATLVVAIIGATFAFFSASATAGENAITGGTLDVGGTFSVSVTQLHAAGGNASSEKLVPAQFGTHAALSAQNAVAAVEAALTAKCEQADQNGGYTGCHIWRIDAVTGQDLATASLKLDIRAPKGTNWSYVLFKNGTPMTALDGTSGTVTLAAGSPVGTFTNAGTDIDMHAGASMNGVAGVDGVVPEGAISETYYLMVYLQNTSVSQNGGTSEGATDETGTYNGTVTFTAAGGEVKATFTVA